MSKSKLNSRKDKPLESVSAPLGPLFSPYPSILISRRVDDDSDDEFNAAALVAETEAAYKPQKRGARGRRRTIDNREKANRKDVLEAMIGDPTHRTGAWVRRTNQTDGRWASVSVQQDVVSGKELPSFASTQDEDTATESEDDLPTATGGVLGKRPGKPAPSSPQKGQGLAPADPPSDTETESESENDLSPRRVQRKQTLPLAPRNHTYPKPLTNGSEYGSFIKDGPRAGGGLVGDDMGLGKTIQTIAFLSAAFQKSGTASDATRRRDRVRALQDEGWLVPTCHQQTKVANVFGCMSEDRCRELGKGIEYVIMAFDTARMNIDHLFHLPWSIVIVDEVHRCKNPNSGTTIALNRFQCRGTAIQNGYKELWTLLDWCSPGRVGTPSQWKNAISVPLAEGQAHRATQAQVSKARLLADRLVNNLLPYFFLRRTKALIADQMPRKFDQAVFCPLAKTQLEVYKRFLDSPDVQLMVRKDDLCDCGSEEKRGYCCYTHNAQGVHWKDLVLKYMNLFVEISNHVILIFPGFKGETDEQRARRREYVKIAFPGQAVRQADMMYGDELCGKWQVRWLGRYDRVSRLIDWVNSVKNLEMLEGQLQRKSIVPSFRSYGHRDRLLHSNLVADLNFCCMDGKTKQEDRPSGMRSLDKFNNDPEVFVFLISTLVAEVSYLLFVLVRYHLLRIYVLAGLNMTSANKVVIFDPNWNPAHDLQAMDRAYRFGQKRDVNVYRLLGAGALEELIYARQIYKQQQMHIGYEASVQTRYFEGVQGSKSHQGELFGLKNIFKLHETALATKMIVRLFFLALMYVIDPCCSDRKANLAEMNWALANMDSTPDGTIKEHTASAERNLVDFMLDDSPPTSQADRISDILNNAGVAYTHDHQNVLLASHVERNITSVAIAGSKREDGEAGVTLANEGARKRSPHQYGHQDVKQLLLWIVHRDWRPESRPSLKWG
ncbi:SNF2 family N-terminal domain [Rhizoctonia solani]|uniref:SNF2 family N-terminal domain n=1 Tax=Rhizoctonia solani TaxID=456999 RepID=A0A8H7M1G5_9AGAM|nr:SNF2 family N-terminal domain [Rhizoctonia solani]